MDKSEKEKALDILEKNVNELQDILQQLTTHRNRLVFIMRDVEDKLGILVEKSSPGGEGFAIINPDDLEDLAKSWLDGLGGLNVCYEDIGRFMERQKVIVAYILAKSVTERK